MTTAALGWARLGRTDFQRHVAVVMRHPIEIDTLPTVLIKVTPWTAAEMARLRALYSIGLNREAYYEIVEDPLDPRRSYLSPGFYSGALSGEIVGRAAYRIVPTTDDRPYFNFIRCRLDEVSIDDTRFVRPEVANLLNSQIERGGGIPLDVIHLLVTGVVSFVFALVFIGVPLVFSRVGREPWPGKAASLVYFSCLGAGFIILELTFIQKLWKFIGYPLYTYSVVLFTLLLAAGLGSLSSPRLRVLPAGRWVRLFFVEYFRPCSWAFALTVAPSWVRSTGGQHSPPPVVGQPEQPSRPAHDAWVLRSAPPAAPGHSRGVLLRFHGKGDASAMAVVTTRLSGRAKQRLPEC